jgi:hypothetical protein
MDGLVIRIALGEQVPLGSGVQDPEYALQDGSCWDRFAARTTVRDVFFREMFSNPFPVVIAQTKRDRTDRERWSPRQLF